jgi:hypothetical protein
MAKLEKAESRAIQVQIISIRCKKAESLVLPERERESTEHEVASVPGFSTCDIERPTPTP